MCFFIYFFPIWLAREKNKVLKASYFSKKEKNASCMTIYSRFYNWTLIRIPQIWLRQKFFREVHFSSLPSKEHKIQKTVYIATTLQYRKCLKHNLSLGTLTSTLDVPSFWSSDGCVIWRAFEIVTFFCLRVTGMMLPTLSYISL